MSVTRTETFVEQQSQVVVTTTYRCESCGFVRRMVQEENAPNEEPPDIPA